MKNSFLKQRNICFVIAAIAAAGLIGMSSKAQAKRPYYECLYEAAEDDEFHFSPTPLDRSCDYNGSITNVALYECYGPVTSLGGTAWSVGHCEPFMHAGSRVRGIIHNPPTTPPPTGIYRLGLLIE